MLKSLIKVGEKLGECNNMTKKYGRLARIDKIGRCYCPAGVIDCIQEYTRTGRASNKFIYPKILSIAESTLDTDAKGEIRYCEIKTLREHEASKFAWRKTEISASMRAYFDDNLFEVLVANIKYGFEINIDDLLPTKERRKKVCMSIYKLYKGAESQIIDEDFIYMVDNSFFDCVKSDFRDSNIVCNYLALNLAYVIKLTENILGANPWERSRSDTIEMDVIYDILNKHIKEDNSIKDNPDPSSFLDMPQIAIKTCLLNIYYPPTEYRASFSLSQKHRTIRSREYKIISFGMLLTFVRRLIDMLNCETAASELYKELGDCYFSDFFNEEKEPILKDEQTVDGKNINDCSAKELFDFNKHMFLTVYFLKLGYSHSG